MALDFPSPATIGQVYSAAGAAWLYDGTKWVAQISGTLVTYPLSVPLGGTGQPSLTANQLLVGNGTAATSSVPQSTFLTPGTAASTYLPLAGGNVTGNLNASGNVGIGTTTPGATLSVNGNVGLPNAGLISFAGATVAPSAGNFAFYGDATNTAVNAPSGAGVILFEVAGSEKMRLQANGNVGIGTTTPAGKLDVAGTVAIGGQTFIACDALNAGFNKINDNGGGISLYLGNASGQQQNIHAAVAHTFGNRAVNATYAIFSSSGTANVSGAWTVISDASVKQASSVKPYTRGLDAILALKPVQFQYTENMPLGADPEVSRIGLMADQVKPHVPEIVGSTTIANMAGDKKTTLDTLEPGNLIYALINAVQELNSKVDALSPPARRAR